MSQLCRSKSALVWMILSCGAQALSGCGGDTGDKLPRHAISGKVTFDGKPLAQGAIAFQPTSESPTPQSATITGGSYSIPKAMGLVPGSYKVSISSTENTGPVEKFGVAPGKTPPPPKELLPAQYNTASTLSAEVKEGASNSFNFDLVSSATSKK